MTVVRAEDLAVKDNKELCNPFVKLFLLPRHSGSRKRKTKVFLIPFRSRSFYGILGPK